MTTAAIVVLISVIVLGIVVISRAVHSTRVERDLRADRSSLHDPSPGPPVATGFRWLERAEASQDPGSPRRGTSATAENAGDRVADGGACRARP
jgi:hypothetical protein